MFMRTASSPLFLICDVEIRELLRHVINVRVHFDAVLQGQIQAIHLEYTDARANLAAALRKAPPNGAVAFRAIATKWLIVVYLLLGDIPERSLFAGGGGPSASKIQALLTPYLSLAMAVRSGDLEAFGAAAAKFHDIFVADGVAKLVVRLRRSVIRTGLRRIHLAYSRISLADGR